jgi:hypothetical protein
VFWFDGKVFLISSPHFLTKIPQMLRIPNWPSHERCSLLISRDCSRFIFTPSKNDHIWPNSETHQYSCHKSPLEWFFVLKKNIFFIKYTFALLSLKLEIGERMVFFFVLNLSSAGVFYGKPFFSNFLDGNFRFLLRFKVFRRQNVNLYFKSIFLNCDVKFCT